MILSSGIRWSYLVPFGLLVTSTAVAEEWGLKDRISFVQRINTLNEGDTKDDVREVLGEPDDIRTREDPTEQPDSGKNEIWCYGTNGHLTYPTLGRVYFDEKETAIEIVGQGKEPAGDLMPEENLRQLIRVLSRVPSYHLDELNPRRIIHAVNAVVPLGKEKALALLDEYLRVASSWRTDDSDGVFLVLRCLFDVPEDPGYMPPMVGGAPQPEEPSDPRLYPRFPIAMDKDIPLLLVYAYVLGGAAGRPQNDVDYFREHGRMRTTLLVPTDRPFTVLDELSRSGQWIFQPTNEEDDYEKHYVQTFLANQIFHLMDTVFEPEQAPDNECWDEDEEEEAQKQNTARAAALSVRWNARNQEYTFEDGTKLPVKLPVRYRRIFWKPEGIRTDMELMLERKTPARVSLMLFEKTEINDEFSLDWVEVWTDSTPSTQLIRMLPFGDHLNSSSSGTRREGAIGIRRCSFTQDFDLPAKSKVRLKLSTDGKTQSHEMVVP